MQQGGLFWSLDGTRAGTLPFSSLRGGMRPYRVHIGIALSLVLTVDPPPSKVTIKCA